MITGQEMEPRAASASPAAEMCAEVLVGSEAYAVLRADWQRLKVLQSTSTVFQSPDFLSIWAKHFAAGALDRTLRTIVVRAGGRAVAIWPLQVTTRGMIRVASAAGRPFSQYDGMMLDPGCNQAEAVAKAQAALVSGERPDLLRFSQLRADNPLFVHLLSRFEPVESEGAPRAEIGPDGFEAYMKRLKPKLVREQRRRMRMLEADGEVGFAVSDDAETASDWLAKAIDMKRAWLTATGKVSTAYVDERTNTLFRDLARQLGDATGQVRLVVAHLTVGGEPIAYEVGLVEAGKFFLYMSSYSDRFARHGAGNVLAQLVIEWCAGHGIQVYDMMSPRSQHKSDWKTSEVEVHEYAVPLSRRGEFYLGFVVRRLRPGLKRAFYALPKPVRSRIAKAALRI
ncbi:GNAT family N-acetyltransferase [Propylenella binzhouense]|nr:GNAT family N-acetyltransferase [Propylenella binzhouense]